MSQPPPDDLNQRNPNDPELFAEDVGEVLPKAVRMARKDKALKSALHPVVETILQQSVRTNPGVMIDILFPVIGQAVRKAVKDMFDKLVEAVSLTLENNLSWRSFKWRMEAWRTGKPYAEILLYHTLLFRAEQVFLIHRESGLLLSDESAVGLSSDGDLVSGMLTAIQDFVRDSFEVDANAPLETLQISDFSVWIESGPSAYIAVILRGHPPLSLRNTMKRAIEEVHAQYADEFAEFEGDSERFVASRAILRDCLQSKRREGGSPTSTLWVLGSILALILGYFGYLGYQEYDRRETLRKLFHGEPGIYFSGLAYEDGGYRIDGLRDPLARSLQEVANEAGIANTITDATTRYFSMEAAMILKRARIAYQPPQDVKISLDAKDILHFSGEADISWIDTTKAVPLPFGVTALDKSQLREKVLVEEPEPEPELDLDQTIAAIEAVQLEFDHKETTLYFDPWDEKLDTIAQQIKDIRKALLLDNLAPLITVQGFATDTGNKRTDKVLCFDRAKHVRDKLIDRGITLDELQLDRDGYTYESEEGTPLRQVRFSIERVKISQGSE